ncbi:hypothetical protein [Streptomyces sp. M92]|uniref:hypothetical protein n=1 Tax=Streptomyces sp. M92 TaxID=2944250 RepID=UPI002349E69D|nr:hypothetical protein [Streptomyces sp. M92]WCN06026.1 hypothetical protein M6G08_30285 [Streptomyces sp. M92]
MTEPACGNNPHHQMSDGDRRVVESFRAYLAARAALLEAADWYAQQGKTVLAASQVAADLRRRTGAEARHVGDGSTATETDEERADREETERDHARGDHTHCGLTCETEMPTEHLRNFVIAKGYPGTKGALAELERRAAAQAAPDADLPARLEAALTERYTALGNPFSEMRRQEQGPDGWPASHPVGAHHVAETLRELLAAGARQDGAQRPNPREICICGHTRGEHGTVSGRLLCGVCDPDSTDNLVCKEYEAL